MAVSSCGSALSLTSGHSFPQLGLGTFMSKPGEVGEAVKMALGIGYRHLDCAMAYGNQEEIGRALKESFVSGKVKREDVFITSKIWNTHHSYANAKKAIDIMLKDLQLSYIDLVLIHFPMGYKEDGPQMPKDDDGNILISDVDFLDTWKAMEEAVKEGKVRSIGLSNFNIKQIERVLQHATIKPAVLQVEVHPYFTQDTLVNFCKKHEIAVTAYCPLANNSHGFRTEGDPNLLEDPVTVELARKYNKTPAQVAIRWGIQRGMSVIPKTTRRFRLEENFHVWDFHLTPEDMAALNGLNRNWRITHMKHDSAHPLFPFHDDA